ASGESAAGLRDAVGLSVVLAVSDHVVRRSAPRSLLLPGTGCGSLALHYAGAGAGRVHYSIRLPDVSRLQAVGRESPQPGPGPGCGAAGGTVVDDGPVLRRAGQIGQLGVAADGHCRRSRLAAADRRTAAVPAAP